MGEKERKNCHFGPSPPPWEIRSEWDKTSINLSVRGGRRSHPRFPSLVRIERRRGIEERKKKKTNDASLFF